ncbi:MAG: hypothetical protein AB8F65_11905 [Woeseiaceae bacterium]
MTLRNLGMLLAIGWIAGCASKPATYSAASNNGAMGYASAEVSPNRYIIGYTAGRGTNEQDLNRLTLRRAAELTLVNGHEWFRVVDEAEIKQNWEPKPVVLPKRIVDPLYIRIRTSRAAPGIDATRIVRDPTHSDLTRVASRQYKIAVEMGSGDQPSGDEVYSAIGVLDAASETED